MSTVTVFMAGLLVGALVGIVFVAWIHGSREDDLLDQLGEIRSLPEVRERG